MNCGFVTVTQSKVLSLKFKLNYNKRTKTNKTTEKKEDITPKNTQTETENKNQKYVFFFDWWLTVLLSCFVFVSKKKRPEKDSSNAEGWNLNDYRKHTEKIIDQCLVSLF